MSKKTAIIFILILFLVFLAGVGVTFAFKGRNMPVLGRVVTIPFVEEMPAKVASKIFEEVNLDKIKSVSSELELKVSGERKYKGFDFKSNQEVEKSENLDFSLKSSSNIEYKADNNDFSGNFNLEVVFNYQGMNYPVSLAGVKKGNKIYFKLEKAPVIPFFDLTPYLDKWYYYDLSEFSQDLSEMPFEKNINLNTNANLSPQDIEKIRDILKKSNFIKVKKRLPDEKIKNIDSYHYQVEIDKENFVKMYKDLLAAADEIEIFKKALGNTNQSEIEKTLKDLDSTIDNLNKYQMEIWVGKENYLLNKFKISGNYTKDSENNKVNLNFSGYMIYVFNQPVIINEPQNAESLDTLWDEITNSTDGLLPLNINKESGGGGAANLKININSNLNSNTNANINLNKNTNQNINSSLAEDSDADGLSDLEEIIYGTDKNNPDTDGDGYKDGDEVKAGYNPNGPGKLDSDSDGLSDKDEELYGTDKNNPDTDGDGYKDGQEVLNGYNPNGPGKLLEF